VTIKVVSGRQVGFVRQFSQFDARFGGLGGLQDAFGRGSGLSVDDRH